MDDIKLIPTEVLTLIPIYNGDRQLLNLFIRKCEYVISKFEGDYRQNEYVLHSITSRLIGDAAVLLSERGDISTWQELKELLLQYFGDSRSEESVATELELLKINQNEDYFNFCNRIRITLTKLIARINKIEDPKVKESKIASYNKMALNVFLYNLPQNLVQAVRLKAPESLEDALRIVLEEVSFQDQFNMHHKTVKWYPIPQASQPNKGYNPNSFMQNSVGFGSSQAVGLRGSSTGTSAGGFSAPSATTQSVFGSVSGSKPSSQQQGFGFTPTQSQNVKGFNSNTNAHGTE